MNENEIALILSFGYAGFLYSVLIYGILKYGWKGKKLRFFKWMKKEKQRS